MTFAPLDICGWLWAGWIFYWVVSAQFVLKTKKNEIFARFQHTVPTLFGIVTIFHRGEVPELSWGSLYYSVFWSWFGVVLTVVGQAFSIWARMHIGKYWSGTVALKVGHKIVDTGPYAMVRHPIYTGLLTGVLGSAMAAGTKEAFAGFVVMVAAYIVKWKREEAIMHSEFGAEYEAYRKRTKAILPFIL